MSSTLKARDLRKEADDLIASGSAEGAALRLAELWRNESAAGTAAFVVSRYEKLREQLPLARYRLAILRSFTVEPAVPLLRAAAFASGIDLTVQLGDFNAYPQDILDEQSSLYRFSPDGVVLAARTADVAPDLWNMYAELSQPALTGPGETSRGDDNLSNSVERYLARYFSGFDDGLPPPGLYHRVLREVEAPLLSAALAATRGNQIRAADLLGVNRNTLRKKIRDLEIQVYRTAGG